MKKYIIESIQTIVGCAIMAAGISLFLLPNQLSAGGFTGLATVLYYLFKVSIGNIMIIINIPLFILAFFRIGKEFFFKAILGTAALSFFLNIMENFKPLTSDRFLACIYGGIVVGVGTAIILKAEASTGGTELLTNIIKSYHIGIRTSSLIMTLDIIIVVINMLFFGEIEIGLYSAITIYIMGKMLDILFEGIYFTKILYIISDKYQEIAQKIGEDIERGVTGLYGKGMYTQDDKMVLLCVTSRRQVIRVRNIIKPIDPKAFIVINNAREVFGKGFKE